MSSRNAMKVVLRALFVAASLATGAVQAGTVSVRFIEPNNYYDIGFNESSRLSNINTLNQQFAELAPRLPDNATLRIDVLDVDLAGKLAMNRSIRGPDDVRILRPPDWPRMHLRYSLEVNGVVRRSGDEWLKNMGFLNGYYPPMYPEHLMVRQWFDERIGSELRADQ